ncbi:choline dehydrogenase-like flavoprotein [Sphingobacterium allocomposti]|uniref:Choline dehydrogenase-like flavoprotein n=1 Tax=Sphingobacterium allocomposti TaxID=415956 RepID=A0A5S5DP81_9SPHI|nr:GMC family oxidoreductase [Sphingobacterium composti Yoo et al. 2007 non Ten et al. 2007]TYP96632.1 choline dehydrogenase-like flavoprotein [Sphingobacterium composti Yoo et al. 2007 non Ten et al. 2007]
MANINIDSIKERTFDAIVIGSGISGGWAAKELCEKGLRTLVLERGRDVKHVKDYPTTNMYPYEFEHRLEMPYEDKQKNPIANRCYAYREDSAHFFVKDDEHPYIQEKEFDWIRGYQVGGKSLLWARQVQRWSDFDFEGPARDGFAVDWPIRYRDLAPWYDHVERFIGVAGNRDGVAALPDGDFLPAYPLNAVENHFKRVVASKYDNRHVISARCAHLSQPAPIHLEQGRVQCQNRVLCQRGCPFGGYFSSNASTLPWAEKTGNMTLRPFSVVESIIYDEQKGKAVGVRVIDTNTKEAIDFYSRVIFVNASALNSNLILLNSISNRFPNGLGNDNGLLGKYIAFHSYTAVITGEYDGELAYRTDGRNPAGGGYIPRFRNVYRQETDFLRGWAATFNASRNPSTDTSGVGVSLKNRLLHPKLGNWRVGSHMMAETIPKESNKVWLDTAKKDQWGVPLLHIDVAYDDNDWKIRADYFEQMTAMFEAAGFQNVKTRNDDRRPGNDIHEMGGARMGHDPKTSLLNKWNQLHSCENVFVTDGACMTSTATQNPSLTYMALTARAVDYALTLMKKGVL